MIALLFAAAAAIANPAPARDWAQTAVDDLHFIRATLRENHPGPVDPENPSFKDWYRTGFDQSIERAQRASDFAGYFFAINYYMSGFRDSHLGALAERHVEDHLAEKRLRRRWPGFLVRYDRGAFYVDAREGGQPPRSGARIVACDGRPIEEWAERIIGDYVGLWFLEGERRMLAPLLLIDEGNPFAPVPHQCTFDDAGSRASIPLDWRPITGDELSAKLPPPSNAAAELRPVGDRAFWIAIPSFDIGHEPNATTLHELTQRIAADAVRIRDADLIVFDVRGNRGGSSAAGDAILGAIWTPEVIAALRPQPAAIDWRLSPGNVRFLRDSNLAAMRRQFGDEAPRVLAYARFVKVAEDALASGAMFYREQPERAPHADPPATHARVVLLTDEVCASACLDFADVVLRLPHAAHYGRPTSADAVYIDNRAVTLPSGQGFFGFSMKVYRGRVRANNQPYIPAHTWNGDIDDTKALEKWISDGK